MNLIQNSEYKTQYEAWARDNKELVQEAEARLESAGTSWLHGSPARQPTEREMLDQFYPNWENETGGRGFEKDDQGRYINPVTGQPMPDIPAVEGMTSVANEIGDMSQKYYSSAPQRWEDTMGYLSPAWQARDEEARRGIQQGEGVGRQIVGGYQDLARSSGAAGEAINQGYAARTQAGLAELNSLSDQDTADLNRAWDIEGRIQQINLQQRGLGNSTVMASVGNNVERGRSDALNQLNDRVARERMDYMTQLSSDELASRETQQFRSTGAGLDYLGAQLGQQTFDYNALMARLGLTGEGLNVQGQLGQNQLGYLDTSMLQGLLDQWNYRNAPGQMGYQFAQDMVDFGAGVLNPPPAPPYPTNYGSS
jgi:hypothetical protein